MSNAQTVKVENQTSNAYGDMITAENTPFVNGSAIYGFVPANFRQFSAGNGTTGVEDNYFKVTSGTSIANYGAIQSFRSVNYQPGSGAIIRFSARFPDPVANSWTGC